MAPLQTRSLPHGIPTIYPSKEGKVKMPEYKITFTMKYGNINVQATVKRFELNIKNAAEWVETTFSHPIIIAIEQIEE